jgi:hypothetical protein
MFKCAAWQIAGDAGVQNAVASIGHEIEPAACHASIEEDVDGRDKPGHDGMEAANTTLIAQFLRVDFGLGEAYRRKKSFLKTRFLALFLLWRRGLVLS